MLPNDEEQLTDRELDAILPAWKAPMAPVRMRAAVFPGGSRPWWTRLWSASVHVPVPVACCVALLLALAAWRWATPRTVYRDRIVLPAANAGADPSQLRPVTELRLRIVRSADVSN